MKTVKEILTENRESVISSIKWVCKVWKTEDVKQRMVEFLAYAEANLNVAEFEKSKSKKSDLKWYVQRMKAEQEKEWNIKKYGKANPSLADIVCTNHQDEVWNASTKQWN